MSLRPGFPEAGGLVDTLKDFERRLTALERSDRLTSASIGSGGLAIKGGALNLYNSSNVLLAILDALGLTFKEADGSDLLVADGSKLRYNRSDGSRQLEITPAGGLKIYAANGTTEQVVLDSAGLVVGGGVVVAQDIQIADDGFTNVSLTTTHTEHSSIVFTIPSWVVTVFVLAYGMAQITNSSGGVQGVVTRLLREGTTFGINPTQDVANGQIGGTTATGVTSLARPVDGTLTVTQEARVTVGTNSANLVHLSALVLGIR